MCIQRSILRVLIQACQVTRIVRVTHALDQSSFTRTRQAISRILRTGVDRVSAPWLIVPATVWNETIRIECCILRVVGLIPRLRVQVVRQSACASSSGSAVSAEYEGE